MKTGSNQSSDLQIQVTVYLTADLMWGEPTSRTIRRTDDIFRIKNFSLGLIRFKSDVKDSVIK